MDNAVTILVGAGAVLDFNHKGVVPSVNSITKEVVKASIQRVDGSKWQLLNVLQSHIVERLQKVGNSELNKSSHPELSFEDILHVLEMCLSYSSCWHDEYLAWRPYPIFGTLIEPNSILKNVDTVEYERASYALQDTVMKIVSQYDSSFREDKGAEIWYRQFWQSLAGSNIFTLNYDSTIEESVGQYEDGFEKLNSNDDYCRFSARKYYNNPESITTIAHMHGSILFSEASSFPFEYSTRDLVKNKDYLTAQINRIGMQWAPHTQAKEKYIQAYIISGARKAEKVINAPYNVFPVEIQIKMDLDLLVKHLYSL